MGSLARVVSVVLVLALAGTTPGSAAGEFPTKVKLPDGFQPEGIATRNKTFYVGSIPTGNIYKGNLKTGKGDVFVTAPEGRAAIGLAVREGKLFVAGGDTGEGYIYDARTGADLGAFDLTALEATFVNDVVATQDAAYFTDSMNPVIYKLPINDDGFGEPETIAITGDLVYEQGFNANGIDATADGAKLVIVQSNTGELFTADPSSGETSQIDLGGDTVTNGDGILLEGRRLWVVQNRDNMLTPVNLSADLSSGKVKKGITHKSFDVPTTVARSGDRLALVNARFGNPEADSAKYWVTQILEPR